MIDIIISLVDYYIIMTRIIIEGLGNDCNCVRTDI